MQLWTDIVEASLDKLLTLEGVILVAPESQDRERMLFYTAVLKNYFRQDAAGIAQLICDHSEWLKAHPDMLTLSKMRCILRTGHVNLDEIRELSKVNPANPPLINAEMAFVSAGAFQAGAQYLEAESRYRVAAALYQQAGAVNKSLRAMMSSIAAYSCAKPDSRLFPEYMNLYKAAMKAGEFLTAGTTLLNISREFQILNGQETALEYIQEAVKLLSEHAMGSREHGLALVHRAHLHLEMKRFPMAKEDLIYALSISNKEVQSACATLATMFDLNLKNLESDVVLPTWSERLVSQASGTKPLAPLEAFLVKLLAEGPKGKAELMEMIYGNKLEFEVIENRFKNLIARVRQAKPNLIVFENNKYRILEPGEDSLLKKSK